MKKCVGGETKTNKTIVETREGLADHTTSGSCAKTDEKRIRDLTEESAGEDTLEYLEPLGEIRLDQKQECDK